MSERNGRRISDAGIGIVSLLLLAATPCWSADAPAKWQPPRMANGDPDLQGMWTNATITPLERPKEFGERLVISDAEAKTIEAQNQQFNEESDAPTDPKVKTQDLPHSCGLGFTGADCGYNMFWLDRGQSVVEVNGERRSSLIVEPKNGRVPVLPERQKQLTERFMMMRTNFDGPEARPLAERCLLAFGSSSGPPMLPVLYNNHYQIVQTKDTVMIQVEMVHDARIIRLGGKHRARQHSQVDGRFHRPLGGRHAGRRDHQLHRQQQIVPRLRTPELQGHRALHSRRRRTRSTTRSPSTIPIRSRNRGRRVSVLRHQRTDLRIRLPRRQLRAARHPCRRA